MNEIYYYLLSELFSPTLWVLIIIAYLVFKKRSGSGDKIRWLKNEISIWKEKGIISEKQKRTLLDRYGKKEKVSSLGTVKILSIMGAVLLGLGVLLFVASNWGKIPDILRTIMVLSITFGTFYLGYDFSYQREGHKVLGKALLLLACLFWGASIALIGQIYHIPTSANWWIFLVWAAPILPVGYFLESTPIFVLSSSIFAVWNVFFSTSKDIANYYYPLIVLAILLPLSKGEKIKTRTNVIGLMLASLIALFGRHDYLVLLISVGLLAYYFVKKDSRLYSTTSSISFLLWVIAFTAAHENTPNYLFILPLAALLYVAYRDNLKDVLAINLASIILWLNLLLLVLSEKALLDKFSIPKALILTYAIGAAYYVIGLNHNGERTGELAGVYKKAGAIIALMATYIFSFKGVDSGTTIGFKLYFFAIAGIWALSLLLAIQNYARNKLTEKSSKYEALGAASVLAGIALLLLNTNGTVNMIAMNAILLLASTLMILYGFEIQNRRVFNAGIGVFVILVITRYLDTLWMLLPRSLAFIAGGILMFALSIFLEKKRREVVAGMKNG